MTLTLVHRARISQLKTKIRSWKFPLKHIPKQKMVKTAAIHNKRKARGKDTIVTFQGQRIKDSTLQAGAARYKDELTRYNIGSPTPCMLKAHPNFTYGYI